MREYVLEKRMMLSQKRTPEKMFLNSEEMIQPRLLKSVPRLCEPCSPRCCDVPFGGVPLRARRSSHVSGAADDVSTNEDQGVRCTEWELNHSGQGRLHLNSCLLRVGEAAAAAINLRTVGGTCSTAGAHGQRNLLLLTCCD
jgi:hypothetical protein